MRRLNTMKTSQTLDVRRFLRRMGCVDANSIKAHHQDRMMTMLLSLELRTKSKTYAMLLSHRWLTCCHRCSPTNSRSLCASTGGFKWRSLDWRLSTAYAHSANSECTAQPSYISWEALLKAVRRSFRGSPYLLPSHACSKSGTGTCVSRYFSSQRATKGHYSSHCLNSRLGSITSVNGWASSRANTTIATKCVATLVQDS